MSYKTLMVHLQVGYSNEAVLRTARSLAEKHKAAVLGVAVLQKTQRLHEEDYVIVGGLIEQHLPTYLAKFGAAEADFRSAMQGLSDIEWRLSETFNTVTEQLVAEARGADLLIVNANQRPMAPTQVLQFDIAELVAHAGRPVLGVPKTLARPPDFARAMVYWKDTVETRRAVTGALPLLQQSSYVSLVRCISDGETAAAQKDMELVTQWFSRHGVTVDPLIVDSEGDVPGRLRAIAREQNPDYAVAGTYSHSRLRERLFGGVTKDIFRDIDRYVLLSH